MRKKTETNNTSGPFTFPPAGKTRPLNAFLDDEGTDHSLEALEVLLSAQERMKGIIECASALNQLMAEAADKDNMPFLVPLIPPGFTQGMHLAPAFSPPSRKGLVSVAKTASASASSSAPAKDESVPSEAYLRLEGVIQTRGFITNEDVRQVLSLTPIQATFRLKQWVADRHVVQRGQRRGARYVAGPRWPPRT